MKTTTLVRTMATAAALLALAALAGCHDPKPEQPATSENVVEEVPTAPLPTKAPPPPVVANAAEADTRDAPPPPDAQTQDDADATGMTARVQRDEAPANDATTTP